MSGMIFVYGAILAIGCTLAPSFMISEGIARIGPGPASAVGGVGPAAAAGVAVFVLGEPFGWPQAAALALTVGGVLLLAGAGSAPRGAASA
ncbi:MAG: EamA family transporter [Pseudomonadota bacterium]